jgi:cell division protein YceG involved in septum cleavage
VRRGGSARRAVLIALAVLGLLAVGPGYVLWSWGAPSDDATPVEFEILRGAGVGRVARDLHAEGLVRDPRTFLVLLRLEGLDRRVGEGLYDLHAAMGAREVAAVLRRGGRPRTVRLVLPEGSRLVDVAARLEAAGLAPAGAALARLRQETELAFAIDARPAPAGAPVQEPEDAPAGDRGADAAPEPAPDSELSPELVPDLVPEPDAEPDREPDTVSEPDLEPEPERGPDPDPDPPTASVGGGRSVDGLEGYLFPASYDVPVRDDLDAIVARFLRRFEQELDDATRSRLVAEGLDLHAWVTLASMVQAEAANDAEMPIIAGVFRNRLDIGMPLQSDPTVAYGLGKDLPQLDFPGGDFDVDHPWNTYTRTGLPAGPIGNPGRSALDAVLAPDRTDAQGRPWFYFLHGRDDDGPVFRPNLDFDGHLRDVARYLRR